MDYLMDSERYSRGPVTGSAGEYNEENIPCIEIPCVNAEGSLQLFVHKTDNTDNTDFLD